MRTLKIEITKAKILGYNVRFDEENKRLLVDATIGLFTEGGRKVTEYAISTYSWDEAKKFDLPAKIVEPIIATARVLEKVVTKHCQDSTLMLEQHHEN